jgi:hypothetical protein
MSTESDIVAPIVNEAITLIEDAINKAVESMPLGEVIEPVVAEVENVVAQGITGKIETGNTTVTVGIDPLSKEALAVKAAEGIVNVSKKIGSGIKGLFHK